MSGQSILRFFAQAFVLATALFFAGRGLAGEPTAQPLLRLEIGMHSAPIRGIAGDVQGRWAVTAAEDKTARVWDVASGKLLTVLRPPLDEGDEGRLYAVAMRPDGAEVAVAGWTGWDWDGQATIYVFERAGGRLLRRLSGLPNLVHRLAYSPDGRWLAVSFGGANGVRIFDAGNGKAAGQDSEYRERTTSLVFSPDGKRLLTSSDDGALRLYRFSEGRLKLWRVMKLAGGERPFAARYSPDGTRIAVGFTDTRVVQILDSERLSEVARASNAGLEHGSLGEIAWSFDGRRLYAGGHWGPDTRAMLRRWPADDWQSPRDITLSEEMLSDLLPLPRGDLLFAAADPAWGVLDANGAARVRHKAAGVDFRGQRDQLRLSRDALRFRFGYQQGGREAASFDWGQRILTDDAPTLVAARTNAPGLAIDNWKNQRLPTLNGKSLGLKPYEVSRCLAIAEDGSHFVLGTDSRLHLYERDGRQRWQQPTNDVVWAINLSSDGRYVVAAYADGTVRWHRVRDGSEVLAFFPHADKKRWVAWTPEGFFASSGAQADDFIGFHLNRGRDQAAGFISAVQLRERFYQPGLISHRLDSDGDSRLAEAVQQFGDLRQILNRNEGRQPIIELLSSSQVSVLGPVEVRIKVRDDGGGITRFRYRVDGVEMDGRLLTAVRSEQQSRSFDLPGGRHEILVSAVNRRGVESVPLRVRAEVLAGSAPESTGHVFAAGVTAYRERTLTGGPRFAADDAQTVARQIEEQHRRTLRRVSTRLLVNEKANSDGIRSALADLAREVAPQDIVVVYLAGRSRSVEGEYQFVAHDASFAGSEGFRKRTPGADDWRTALARLRSTRGVLLLDLCGSGALRQGQVRGSSDEKDALERLARLSGRAIIASVTSDHVSCQGLNEHGLLTQALLEGFAGKARRNDRQALDVRDLSAYVQERLPEISRQKWGYEIFPFVSVEEPTFAVLPK